MHEDFDPWICKIPMTGLGGSGHAGDRGVLMSLLLGLLHPQGALLAPPLSLLPGGPARREGAAVWVVSMFTGPGFLSVKIDCALEPYT